MELFLKYLGLDTFLGDWEIAWLENELADCLVNGDAGVKDDSGLRNFVSGEGSNPLITCGSTANPEVVIG